MNIIKNTAAERLMLIGLLATLTTLLLVGSTSLDNADAASGAVNFIQAGIIVLLLFLAVLFVVGMKTISARGIAQQAANEGPQLKASALQDAIFNSATFSSIAIDEQGLIQIFNVGAERMLGYSASEVIDKMTPADISDQDELVARAAELSIQLGETIRPGLEGLVAKASRAIEDIYELTYIRKDGSRFPARVSVTALRDPDGRVIGYLLIGTDNTVGKQAEAERNRFEIALQDTNVQLERARSAADKANRAKSEFLSSMSHELRTPLNAVLGFAQLMSSEVPPPPPNQQRSIDQILKGGWYLLRLINEILDLAMIESGKVTMSQESMSLTDVLQDCQGMIEPEAAKRGIRLEFPTLDKMFYVHADRTRVKQVMINLLSNAIKYNDTGGSVVVRCGFEGADKVRISVTDTGQGLAPEQLANLFQPFNRLGQEHKLEEGTGIGLVVTKQLVELMGGTLTVESSIGAGTTFSVDFTTATAPALSIDNLDQVAMERRHLMALAPDQQPTLLYVEDNPANLTLVEQLIARRGDLRLITAIDGNLGVELARAYLPEVILMDINLPGIGGFEALEILANDPATRHIPVLALSANAMPRDIEKGLAAGFQDYLTKPIRVREFMSALDGALERAAAHHAARPPVAANT
ncbi:MAG: ATP-binding protein [Pseudomonadota bacterium]